MVSSYRSGPGAQVSRVHRAASIAILLFASGCAGSLDGGEEGADRIEDDVTGAASSTLSTAAAQSRKAAVLLVNFSNNPTEQPLTLAQVRASIFTDPDSPNAFWKEASFGQLEFVGNVNPVGDVFGYFTLDVPNTDCAANLGVFFTSAMAKAQAAGVDLAAYQHLLFLYVAPGCPVNAQIGGQRTHYPIDWYREPARKMLGFNLGLWNASGYACEDDVNTRLAISHRCKDDGEFTYADPFDVMGDGGLYHPSVWGKAYLGFLSPGAVATVERNGTYTLHPSFRTDGTQAIRILRSIEGGVRQYYYLEYRRPSGVFDNFAPTDPVANGVTIRLAGDHAQPAVKTRLIDTTPTSQTGDGRRNFRDATLAVGQTFHDPIFNIHITVVSVAPEGAQVQLTVQEPAGSGTGLRGDYFDNADLTAPVATRVDPTVNFSWAGAAPHPSVAPTTFSVRWQGQVLAQYTGAHTFYTTSDDGVRLWVDGQLLVNNWTVHDPTENSGSIVLVKGRKYAITMEYFQSVAGSLARLEWSTPISPRAVVPRSQLFPTGGTMFATSFESAEPPVTWNDVVDWSVNIGGYCCGLTSAESSVRQGIGLVGQRSLLYSGSDNSAATSYTYNKVFDVSIPVLPNTELSYSIYPQSVNATFVAIDLIFTDGTALRDIGAVDQFGVWLHPTFQGRGGRLVTNTWNPVRSVIGRVAAGKVIDRILVAYDQPENTGSFRGYIDNIVIQ